MNNQNSDGNSDNDWEDRGELVWNEFDWERYLRDQDEAILRYLAHYDKLPTGPERLDEAAKQMGWSQEDWNPSDSDELTDADMSVLDGSDESEPYTLHKNPVFIATRSLYLSLTRTWEQLAGTTAGIPADFALGYLASLNRGETQAILAIQALDFGDYAMAISLLKRALQELNGSMARLSSEPAEKHRAIAAYRGEAIARLFDLREIWLRVMTECREELELPSDDEDDD
ncbi:MAG: hypothetical protein ABII82_04445 [Verrucomicrobiota bacterium]